MSHRDKIRRGKKNTNFIRRYLDLQLPVRQR